MLLEKNVPFLMNLLKKKMHIFYALALLGMIGIGVFLLTKKADLPPPEDIKIVKTTDVQRQTLKKTVTFRGIIQNRQTTHFIAKAGGILDYTKPAGSHVRKGELIAKLDNIDIETHYKAAKREKDLTNDQFKRDQGLFERGVISRQMMESKKSAFLLAERDLARAKIDLDKTRFYAPFDGVVGLYEAKEGAQLKEGEPVVTLFNPGPKNIEFDIPVHLIASIHDGQEVEFQGKIYPLSYVQKMVNEKNHMCPAYVSIDCSNCVAGEAVTVTLPIEEKSNAIVIPFAALLFKGNTAHVYALKNDQLEVRPVSLGMREKDLVEIKEGLTEKDVIVVEGIHSLYEGARVKKATA